MRIGGGEKIIIGLSSFIIMYVSSGCERWGLRRLHKKENSIMNTLVINSGIQKEGGIKFEQ